MTTTSSPAPGCPVRKLEPEARRSSPALEQVSDDGPDRWVVRSFALARQVLRDPEATTQAGFGAERMPRGDGADAHGGGMAAPTMRPPILYLEGAPHRTQRSAAARFFAPKVTEAYRPMMEALSEELVGRLRPDRGVDLRTLSM